MSTQIMLKITLTSVLFLALLLVQSWVSALVYVLWYLKVSRYFNFSSKCTQFVFPR
jgi:hypothetical protein